MLNNVLERLELDGQTFDLAGLGRRLAERIHRFQPKPVDPEQEDVKISFAAKDAVHVRCNDGRLEITLSIARLSKGSRKWKDFQVRAFYRPVVQGRSVDLARDGIVQLIGPRMNAGSQIALRGVFSKVFSQKEPIHATPESFVKNPKLEGVAVTQFVIDDGWIGAAIGPQRTVTAQPRQFSGRVGWDKGGHEPAHHLIRPMGPIGPMGASAPQLVAGAGRPAARVPRLVPPYG